MSKLNFAKNVFKYLGCPHRHAWTVCMVGRCRDTLTTMQPTFTRTSLPYIQIFPDSPPRLTLMLPVVCVHRHAGRRCLILSPRAMAYISLKHAQGPVCKYGQLYNQVSKGVIVEFFAHSISSLKKKEQFAVS